MPEYIKDRAVTLERLGELVEAQRFADYELAAAIAVLRVIGTPWETIGEGLGFPEGSRKQAASQWFRRWGAKFGLVDHTTKQATVAILDDPECEGRSERERLARVLGLGNRVTRYQVRLVTGGRRGVTKVLYRVVSTHLDLGVAAERADRLEGEAEVWAIEADGRERRVDGWRTTARRRREARRRGAAAGDTAVADDEAPF